MNGQAKTRKKWVLRLLTLSGVALMVYLVYRIGLDQIVSSLRQITVGQFIILFLLRLAYWLPVEWLL